MTNFNFRTLLSPLVLPLVFFVLSLVVIFAMWDHSRDTRIKNLEYETAVTAEQIKLRLEAWVDSRTAILQHMGSSMEILSQLGEVNFEQAAQEVIALYPGFQAINLIDKDWVIRIVVPEAINQAALDKDLHLHPDPGVGLALQEALDSDEIHRSPLIHLLQGKPGFATYFPVHRADGSLIGTINGVFLIEDVVNNCLSEKRLKERFAIRIFTLSREIAYSHDPVGFPPDCVALNDSQDIRIVDKNWLLCLIPQAALNRPLLMTGAGRAMISSIILALALSLLLRAYLLRLVELRVSRKNFKLLVDNQADMLIKLDSEFRITFVSPTTVETIGVPEAEILGRFTSDFVHADDSLLLEENIDQIVQGQENLPNLVVRVQSGDDWIWSSWTTSNVYDKNNRIKARISVGRDITRERELESLFRQGQKLQAVGQLAGGVAHDFNNIIQAILGYLGFVKADLLPESEAFRDLTQAELAAERAATLTRQLLAFSRRQLLQPVLLDLNKVTMELLPMLHRLLGESIDLKLNSSPSICPVKADRGQIEQILVNLCVNARDAIEEDNGTITIETKVVNLDTDFCHLHQWAEPGKWIKLSLTDSGQGMDEEILSQIFEPFFTTKEMGKGTGLGLATVYGIVKQHGGLIDVASNPGKGTSFSLYLSALDEDMLDDQPTVSTTVESGMETVLLAEDEEMVRSLTSRILEGAGYRVLSAEDGHQARQIWTDNQQEIDLVVMDVVMPRLGGRELSRLIRQDRPNMGILFISGYDSESFRAPLIDGESMDLLLKPFTQSSLLGRVREILNR